MWMLNLGRNQCPFCMWYGGVEDWPFFNLSDTLLEDHCQRFRSAERATSSDRSPYPADPRGLFGSETLHYGKLEWSRPSPAVTVENRNACTASDGERLTALYASLWKKKILAHLTAIPNDLDAKA